MAKWDLSKLPEGRKPLPDEWFAERAQMQERIKGLEELLWAAENDANEAEAYAGELEAVHANLRAMIADQINSTGDDPEIMAATRAEWAARAKAAEAKLAKAVEIAELFSGGVEYDYHGNIIGEEERKAMAELAELTGGKDA